MSTYKEEMYKFIASKENFDVAAEIHDLFPEVRDRMINEFWELVKVRFHELDEKHKWTFEIEGSGICIFLDECEACVCVEEIHKSTYYGIWFNRKIINESKGREILAKNDAVNWMKEGKEWFYWKPSGDDFQNSTTLKKIVPADRDVFINEWVERLLELVNDTKDDLIVINKTKT